MTDKEFKRLSRAELIDIIYQLQLQIDKLNEQNQALESELKDKRLRLSNAGNIAEASLEIDICFTVVETINISTEEIIAAMEEKREKLLKSA